MDVETTTNIMNAVSWYFAFMFFSLFCAFCIDIYLSLEDKKREDKPPHDDDHSRFL